ncbi:MAG: MmgE/PrpD family protein [Proteobacteria bacterium]|nr:MmgE/PrpD family protein [Pseudomonadota bacterium]
MPSPVVPSPKAAKAAAAAPSVTADFAAFIAATSSMVLPDAVKHATCRAFVNWIGCALGAANDDTLAPVYTVARGLSGREQASVVGTAERFDVVNAAMVNAVRANALDYDDMHVPTLIHPTGAVVAAALAVAEHRRATGQTLLAAIATGIEIECRLGRALFPQHYNAGWHSTATLGTVGAAAAASAVLGLDAGRAAYALGIAATQASGLKAMLLNSCKSFNIGNAAAGGVLAALLAEAGLDSSADVFAEKTGFFAVFGTPLDLASLTSELGTRYLTAEISLKPYPCGVVIHPLIDACLELVTKRALKADAVRAISIQVHPRAIELAGLRHPDTEIKGRFSLYHAAALALARRSAGLAAFEAADVHDVEFHALRELMTVTGDAQLQPSQARVQIELKDGSRLQSAIDHPSGSPQRPLTDPQLREKFSELAHRVLDEPAAETLFEACMSLDRLPDAGELHRHWNRAGSVA